MDAVTELLSSLNRQEAYILLEDICGITRDDLILKRDMIIDDEKKALLKDAVVRRKKGEPIQYITGSWPFMGEDFCVGEGVLIPRDDTEVLVREADRLIKRHKLSSCLDLCSGSGIIALTLKRLNKDIQMTAVEKYDSAFCYLEKNRKKLNYDIHTVKDDIINYHEKLCRGSFDLIVSNPPYIRSDDIWTLQKEISYEPKSALDGGDDGLIFYREIINKYTDKIREGGFIAFEIGEEQSDAIASLLAPLYTDISFYRDIQDLPRAVTAKKR